jgi:hypothetical protein
MSNDDLKKAIAFLLEKDMKEYSLEKKKEFLLKKVSPEVVEKALSLYPVIENNVNKTLDEAKKDMTTTRGFLDSFFDLGIISTVLLTTLGINYLIDLNRNKKSDLFYKDIEKKIKEELSKSGGDMKNEIRNDLQTFMKKDEVADSIKEHLDTFTKQKGLNLNLSSKTMKDNMVTMKNEISSLEQKVKELNVKMENNNLIFKQEMLKELNDLITENNKKLLMQIIENQNKLLLSINDKKEILINDSIINRPDNSIFDLNKSKEIKPIDENIQYEDFKSSLQGAIGMISGEKDVQNLLKGLNVY